MNLMHRASALSLFLLAACESGTAILDETTAAARDTPSRSLFYTPSGDVCRNDFGTFAAWGYFANPQTCRGCNEVNKPAGLDGDEFTAASILVGATVDGTLSIFATAPPGEVFPAGTRPAVIAFHERTAPGVVLQGDVRTYLNGEVQDQSGIDFPVDELDGQYAFNYSAYGGVNTVMATKPFDAIELFVRYGPGFAEHIQVYEFCVDTNEDAF